MDNIPQGVYTEVALYQVDTVDELHPGQVVRRDTDQEDTSPRVVLLQDKGFVPRKAAVLDTVLVQGNLLVGVPSQGNLRAEAQYPGKVVEVIQAASRSGAGLRESPSLVLCRWKNRTHCPKPPSYYQRCGKQ